MDNRCRISDHERPRAAHVESAAQRGAGEEEMEDENRTEGPQM